MSDMQRYSQTIEYWDDGTPCATTIPSDVGPYVLHSDAQAAIAAAERRVEARWVEIARIDRENARVDESKIVTRMALEAISDAYERGTEQGQRDALAKALAHVQREADDVRADNGALYTREERSIIVGRLNAVARAIKGDSDE